MVHRPTAALRRGIGLIREENLSGGNIDGETRTTNMKSDQDGTTTLRWGAGGKWIRWAAAGLLMLAGEGLLAQVTGQWNFEAGTLAATVGRDLGYFDGEGGATSQAIQFGTTASFGIAGMDGQAVKVVRVPKNSATMGLVMQPDMAANGGGSGVNQYSMVLDVFYPTASAGRNRALLQCEDPFVNGVDAAVLVGAGDGVGADGVFHGAVTPETWHRVVVTVDLAATPPEMVKYVDGAWVGRQTLSQGVDGRWALGDRTGALGTDAALLFTDRNGSSEVTYVSSLQVHNQALAPTYVAALGGPAASKIPATVTPRALVGPLTPVPGEPLAVPGVPLEARIFEGAQAVPVESIEWRLDGVAIVPEVSRPSSGLLVLRYDPGLLPPSSVHTVTLRFQDPSVGAVVDAGSWGFTMAPYNLPPLDPAVGSMLFLGFDETGAEQGGPVSDQSPEGNHGILRLEAETGDHKVDGVIGKALDFKEDQVTYVELTKPWSGLPNTFSVWVKVSPSIPDSTRVGVILGTFSAANNINWELHTQGRPRIYWNAGAPDWNVSGFDFRTGSWEHLAFVRNPDTDTLVLYRNGRRIATRTGVGANVIPTVPSYVGADRRGAGTPQFQGALDELVVYSRVLSDTEIWRLYARSLNLPKYLFPVPQVVDVTPTDGAVRQVLRPAIEVRVDEVNSQVLVDRATVTLSLNGTQVPVQLRDEGGYLVASHTPAGALGSASTNRVVLTYRSAGASPSEVRREWSFVTAPLPSITQQPADLVLLAGATASFTVQATATPPVTFQWQRGGLVMEGATNSSLILTNIQTADEGEYRVVVRDTIGEVTSDEARLEVRGSLPAEPAESLRIGLNAHWPFDTDFKSPVFGLDGTARNGASISAPGRIGAGAVQFVQASSQSVGVSRAVIPNNTLTYSVAGWFKVSGGTGRRFLWETSPANWAISTEITPAGTLKVFARNANSVSRDLDTLIAPDVDTWHHVAVVFDAALGEAAIYYDGTRFEQPLLLEQGVGTGDTTGFNIGTYRAADGRFFDGLIDDVAVWGRTLTATEVAWLASGNGVPAPLVSTLDPIVFVAQPQPVNAVVGSTAFLSVNATGTAPLAYQWRKDGQVIPGATATNLVVGLVAMTNGGVYSVVVSDAEKSRESSGASVTVMALPSEVRASLLAGLSASWSFDEDFKSSVAGFDGVAMKGASITNVARVGGGSVTLSQAAQQYVDVTAQVIPDGTLTYSVAGWCRSAGGTGRRFLWETSPSNWAISAEISAAGNLQVFTRQSVLNSLNINTLVAPQPGDWHHLAAVYDAVAGEVRVWVNGNRVNVPFPIVVGAGTAPTTGFHMGSYRAADGRFFEGQLDDIGVWNRHLTEAEIQHLAAGNPIVAPAVSLRPTLTSVVRVDGGVRLTWQDGKAPYRVEFNDRLGSDGWQVLTPSTDATTVLDPAVGDEARFYRVVGTP